MTCGEAPWSLGLLERANAIVKETYCHVEVELPNAPSSIILFQVGSSKERPR